MKKSLISRFRFFCQSSLRVGWFLAWRQIQRSSKGTTFLIIFIMVLTFLNLVFVSGILSGLVAGSSNAYRSQYSGDLILSNYESKDFINNSSSVIKIMSALPEIESITPRLLSGAVVEANYSRKDNFNDNPDSLSSVLTGIDPMAEDEVTNLSDLIVAGEYLENGDRNQVLVGSSLLSAYSRNTPGDETLDNVDVGDTIRVRIGDIFKELQVKGVVKSKIGEVSRRIYMTDKFLRQLIQRPSGNVNEIAAKLEPGSDPDIVKEELKKTQVCDCAKIETWEESQGQFFKDISRTFSLLGNLIGGIGVAVASITVFIVVFINAITRRRYIGILKGIGICGFSIQISYMIQSLFYSLSGSIIGSVLLFAFLKPYIDRNPIDFPFSDGILVAPLDLPIIRIVILIAVTIIAGYIPAKIIVNKNTLDSILGRR